MKSLLAVSEFLLAGIFDSAPYLHRKPTVMDLTAEREHLAKKILLIEDIHILKEIKLLIDISLQTEEREELLDEYDQEIDQAVLDIKNGQFITHEALKLERRSW